MKKSFISYFKCSNTLESTPLLYPIINKNYASTGFISSQWNSLQYNIRSAFMITFFGYGAPKTDILGKKLMKLAWGNLKQRKMEQIEIKLQLLERLPSSKDGAYDI